MVLSLNTLPQHHFDVTLKRIQKLWDFLWNILKVAIHYYDHRAARMLKSCADRVVLAEVTHKPNSTNPGPGC